METFAWFNSSDQVDKALAWVAIIGSVIELAVAVGAVINVHKEIEKQRKKKLEKYIEIFACLAAFFFLAEALLGWRSSMLLGKELEMLKTEVAWRTINPAQETRLVALLKPFTDANPMANKEVHVNVKESDFEARWYAKRIVDVLNKCGFNAKLETGFTFDDPTAPIPLGLGIFGNGPLPPSPALEIMKASFVAVGIIPQAAGNFTNLPADLILSINVWHKPEK